MFLRIPICSVLPILLVQANHREKRSAANIPNTSPQDQASQEVADKCVNPGPCDENAKYRTYDGSCNNLRFPMWGMTNTATVRILPAVYSDGKKLPRKGEDGQELPNARELRQKLILDRSEPDDRRYWTLVVSWAQFISHDTGHSVPKVDGISCCSKEGKILDAFSDTCMPILVSKEDKFYGKHNVSCIDMVRAKTTDDLGCPLTPVQQIIDVTHPIDASTIYGSNKTIADSLRLFQKGQLRFQTFENGQYPPNHPRPREQCDIRDNEPEVCYVAGDLRVNQNSVLTPIQIIVFRLHNQFAIKLADINPSWSDEILYQESRRIVIAIVQWITYKEFVPILIGEKLVKEADIGVASTGFETSYDLFTNPSTINEFITAAYRSLHSIIAGKIKKKRCADQMDDETDYTEGNEGNGEEREKEEEEEEGGEEEGGEDEEEEGKGEKRTEKSILSLFEKAAEKLIASKDSKERCLDKAEEDDENEDESEEEEEEKEEKSILSSIFGNKKEDELANKVGISSEIELVSWMQRPYIVQNNLDQFLRGQQRQFIQPQDKYETGSINSMLFHGKRSYGDDLEAISIQRQRDFGMPCYNDFRAYSNLPRAKSFEDLLDVMTKDDIEQLKSVYSSVDLIDLYVGGLYERPTKDGGLFGPTFRNLVAEQFYRWKHGDRYFLTFANQSGSFTLEQLDELRKTSSGWLFCQGGNDISLVHSNNMNKALPGNGLRPCSKLPQLDLTKWKV